MATRTIDVSQLAARYRKLGAKVGPAITRGLRSAGERARALMVERSQQGAFDQGGYARGWKAHAEGKSLTIYNQAPYSAVIEFGRRPGRRQPPTKALIPWVRRKLGVSDSDAKSVAFLVARKIGQRGIPGKLILAKAEGAITQLINLEIEDSFRSAVAGR